jgi:hypothetical protein
MNVSDHAQTRCQQRGIKEMQMAWLLSYGEETHHRGARIYHFTREGYEALIREVEPEYRQMAAKSRSAYIVVGENETVVTTARRTGRFVTDKPQRQRKQQHYR